MKREIGGEMENAHCIRNRAIQNGEPPQNEFQSTMKIRKKKTKQNKNLVQVKCLTLFHTDTGLCQSHVHFITRTNLHSTEKKISNEREWVREMERIVSHTEK